MNSKEPTKPGKKFLHGLAANVIVFGFVSFLTDVSAEMIYPLLPLFLSQTLGAGPIFLGLIEGVAESTCSFLKLYSGIHADRARDRSKLVLFGYTVSSFSRPLMALAQVKIDAKRQVLVADFQCGLVLTDAGTVLGSYPTE